MFVSGHMDEFELEQENTRDPAIDGRVGLQVRVINHPFDILSVDLDCEVSDTENPYSNSAESAVETE